MCPCGISVEWSRHIPAVFVLGHYRMAQCEQTKKIVCMLFVGLNGVQKAFIEPLELGLVVGVEGKVHSFQMLRKWQKCEKVNF